MNGAIYPATANTIMETVIVAGNFSAQNLVSGQSLIMEFAKITAIRHNVLTIQKIASSLMMRCAQLTVLNPKFKMEFATLNVWFHLACMIIRTVRNSLRNVVLDAPLQSFLMEFVSRSVIIYIVIMIMEIAIICIRIKSYVVSIARGLLWEMVYAIYLAI